MTSNRDVFLKQISTFKQLAYLDTPGWYLFGQSNKPHCFDDTPYVSKHDNGNVRLMWFLYGAPGRENNGPNYVTISGSYILFAWRDYRYIIKKEIYYCRGSKMFHSAIDAKLCGPTLAIAHAYF
jgi:hypothetical protein